MPRDERLFEEAEGFLELELAESAERSLRQISAEGREKAPYLFHSMMGETLRQGQKHEEAIPHFVSAKRLKPADLGNYINLGWCLKRSSQLEQAIEELLEAERVASASKSDGYRALIHYNLSCYYALAGERKAMLDRLKEALELDPSYRDMIPDEPDFDSFREDPAFQELAWLKV